MTLSYVDESGVQQSQSFSFGIVLSGNIILVLQSPQVVQGTDSLVVSGSILNEGFSSAYYASVTGTLAGTKTPSSADYVGEVDPNTPVPFSVTVPYTPQNAGSLQANISIVVSYENSLGAAEQFTQGIPTTITPSGSGQITTSSGTSSGSGLAPYFVYGLIVMIVLVAVVGAVYVRRNRPRTPKSHEADESKVF
jgi:cobalamin biosynthesis Mg chelatase CobN